MTNIRCLKKAKVGDILEIAVDSEGYFLSNHSLYSNIHSLDYIVLEKDINNLPIVISKKSKRKLSITIDIIVLKIIKDKAR